MGVYLLFVCLGLLSRIAPAAFFAMVALGLVFPVMAVRAAGGRLGYTRARLRPSLVWAAVIGLVMAGITVMTFGWRPEQQPLLAVQLLVGAVVWTTVMSPFQENLFRGWMQPRLQRSWGRGPGLVVTAAAFAVWHLAPPLTGTSTSDLPIATPSGLLSAFVLGLLTGLARDRTQSMVGPRLGHALAGLALVAEGGMVFVQYRP